MKRSETANKNQTLQQSVTNRGKKVKQVQALTAIYNSRLLAGYSQDPMQCRQLCFCCFSRTWNSAFHVVVADWRANRPGHLAAGSQKNPRFLGSSNAKNIEQEQEEDESVIGFEMSEQESVRS